MKYFIHTLTLFRIVCGPLIFLLILYFEYFGLSLALFLLCSFTDFLDGFLARKYFLTSDFGEILDPIADKILVVFLLAAIALSTSSIFVAFCGSMIISREFWVSALRDFNSRTQNTSATKVSFLAKLKTAFQFAAISSYLLAMLLSSALLILISNFILFTSFILAIKTSISYTSNTFQSIHK